MTEIDRRIPTLVTLCLVVMEQWNRACGDSDVLRGVSQESASRDEPRFLASAVANFLPGDCLVFSSWGPGDKSRDHLADTPPGHPVALSDLLSRTLLQMKRRQSPSTGSESTVLYIHTPHLNGQPVRGDRRVDGYLLHVEIESLPSLREGLNKMIRSLKIRRLWNPYAIFFVHVNQVSSFTDGTMLDAVRIIFELLWGNAVAKAAASFCVPCKDMYKSYVLGQNVSDQSLICEIYSWSPFHRHRCDESVNVITLVSNWNVRGDKTFTWKTSFPIAPPRNLGGCEIVVVTSQMLPYIILPESIYYQSYGEGVEMRLLRILEKAFGFKATLLIPPTPDYPRGNKQRNGSWDGTLGYLSQHKLGIAVHTYVIIPARDDDFDYTTPPHLSLEFTWMVPRAGYLPRSTSLFRIFSITVWSLVILSLPIAAVFLCVMARGTAPVIICSLYAWASLLGISYHAPYRLREFLLFWLYYCLVANAAYQSGLISVLTHPGYEHQIENEKDLVDSSLDIEYHKLMDTIIVNIEDPYIRDKILHRRRTVEESPNLLRRVALDRNLAVLTPRLAHTFQGLQYVDETGHPLIFTFRNNVVRPPIVFYVSKGNPLLARMNGIIMKSIDAGLVEQIVEDVRITSLILYTPLATSHGSHAPKPLGLKHMQGVFYILACGVMLSLFTIIFEIVFVRCSIRRIRSPYIPKKFY